ncbi:RNA polymerase sigma-70 factor, ECF subfamily [Flavobacterium gillisiae]|uniref:RNA polymerase sigma-70 factor, ECF subfamily n=1 Tax=Flavobacterium gillisiae TaxID=150146 RepID=A0A1H3X504_9FLAO|nr:sigma-70 family RNA polymerase sigma factor [Flavobacterium gillisiae]SDZ94497.1 RNA polymerase sigma-70 factor, ECF subfamily [Flavobacterium gillisiae]
MEKYSSVTDEELASIIGKTNDTVLFGVLYDRYEHLVYNKCYGFVRSIDEAKDLTQDVFLHVFIKISTFNGKSKFSTWLYSVTYNFCVNYLSRDKERKISSHSSQVEAQYDLAIEVNDFSLYQMQVNKLEKALTLIPPEDRMILQMKYQDDVPIKELQEVLELSESAVKMRLSRAKVKIAEVYNKLEI